MTGHDVEKGKERKPKRATGFRVSEELSGQIEQARKLDGSKSFQQFCEKAVRFYISYLMAEEHEDYVTLTMRSTLTGLFEKFEADLKRSNFKVAASVTEQAMALMLATQFTPEELRRIRGKAIGQMKQYGGPPPLEVIQKELTDAEQGGEGEFQDW